MTDFLIGAAFGLGAAIVLAVLILGLITIRNGVRALRKIGP